MACINVSVYTADDGIIIYPNVNEQENVNVITTNQQINITSSRVGDRLNTTTSRLGDRFEATVSIICSIEEFKAILKVSPDEIQWITDDKGVFFEVESNVEWIILTS